MIDSAVKKMLEEAMKYSKNDEKRKEESAREESPPKNSPNDLKRYNSMSSVEDLIIIIEKQRNQMENLKVEVALSKEIIKNKDKYDIFFH